jgi:hypothetical protein
MPNDSAFKKTEILIMAVLAVVAMTLVAVAVVPDLRAKAKEMFMSSGRNVIAKVSGKVGPEGPMITVLKIKNQNNLSLEVYSHDEEGSLTLLTKIPLFEARDGHFLLQGNATNLALTDVDKDGTLEIVAPTYDEQMVPRLNIFRYNPQTKFFDRASAPEGFEP